MEETRTGGKKEFIFSVMWAIILLFIGRLITALLPEYKIIGTVFTLILFCVLGFFVLTRYSAIYTYSLKDKRFRVNRSIGHRNKEVEFALSAVKSVTGQRPKNVSKRAQNMRSTVFSGKNIWYIVYEKNKTENILVCEISKEMADKIKRQQRGLDKND